MGERLDGTVALVTGASSGIGEATARTLARAGATVRRTVDELGRLDTVINNAGVMLLGPAADAPLEEWERMVAINVSGVLYVSHAAIAPLLEAAATGPRN